MAQGVPGRLRLRIFLTFRHYKGGTSSAKRTGGLYPRRNPWYSLSEAESTSGQMVLSGVPWKKIPSDTTDPGTVRLVAQCLNHYAIPGPNVFFFKLVLLFAFFPFKFYIRFSEFLFLVLCSPAVSIFANITLYFPYAYKLFSFLYDLLYIIFLDYLHREDGSSKLLRNVGSCLLINNPFICESTLILLI